MVSWLLVALLSSIAIRFVPRMPRSDGPRFRVGVANLLFTLHCSVCSVLVSRHRRFSFAVAVAGLEPGALQYCCNSVQSPGQTPTSSMAGQLLIADTRSPGMAYLIACRATLSPRFPNLDLVGSTSLLPFTWLVPYSSCSCCTANHGAAVSSVLFRSFVLQPRRRTGMFIGQLTAVHELIVLRRLGLGFDLGFRATPPYI